MTTTLSANSILVNKKDMINSDNFPRLLRSMLRTSRHAPLRAQLLIQIYALDIAGTSGRRLGLLGTRPIWKCVSGWILFGIKDPGII